MKTKKVPQRQCSGCGQRKAKKDLLRVVKSNEGEISLDLTGKKAGRGAYICNNLDCLLKAKKSRRLEKSLSTAIPELVYQNLEGELSGGEG